MNPFPRLSVNEAEHRRLVMSLLWRYGRRARWVAQCAQQDAAAGIFGSSAEAITRYNDHFDSLHAKKDREGIRCP